MKALAIPALAAMVLLAVAGCSPNTEELQEWMEQQRRDVKPNVTPLQPPRKFNRNAQM